MNAKRIIPLFILLCSFTLAGKAQIQSATKATATISGRVTIEGQAAPGVEVMLKPGGNQMADISNAQSPPTITASDADGRYRFTSLAAGGYRITAHAPAYVIQSESRMTFESGKTLTVADGETVESVDFAMTRGGVVTGKVTDEYGRPVIGEPVKTFRLDAEGKREKTDPFAFGGYETDDRGIFRIFGLEAGRYLVGAGSSSEEINLRMGAGGFYKRTYHPDTTDEAKATVIELKPGGEVEGVDIKLARATKGYTASGRVIEAETGKPIAGLMIGYGVTKKTGASFGMGNAATNSAGEFRLEGLSPNSYNTFVANLGASDLYADPLNFEIVGGDVSGLEIKMSRGASISGTAVVEGTRDPAALAELAKVQLQAMGDSKEMMIMINGGTSTINANGGFRITGVRAGKTRVTANTMMGAKGLSLARIEHNGTEVKQFDVAVGDQITGVRLVFSHGTGVIAGRVEIKGGALPPTARMSVTAVREGDSPDDFMNAKRAVVDGRGQFLLEGLSQGAYKVRLSAYDMTTGESIKNSQIEQSVTIAGGARQEITMVLDLSKKEGDK